MAPDSLLAPLVRVPLFNGLSKFQLQALADAAEQIAIDGGKTIIAEDQEGDAAFLLVKGRAARMSEFGRPSEPLPLGQTTPLTAWLMMMSPPYVGFFAFYLKSHLTEFSYFHITFFLKIDTQTTFHDGRKPIP